MKSSYEGADATRPQSVLEKAIANQKANRAARLVERARQRKAIKEDENATHWARRFIKFGRKLGD